MDKRKLFTAIALSLALLLITGEGFKYIILLSAVVFLFYTIPRVSVLWLSASFILLVFASEYAKEYVLYRMNMEKFALITLFVLFLFLIYIWKKSYRIELAEEKILFFFLFLLLLQAAHGLISGYQLKAVIKETIFPGGIISFFILRREYNRKLFIITWIVMIVTALIISGEYFTYFNILHKKALYLILDMRVATRQGSIGAVFLPIGFSLVIWGRRWEKAMGIALLLSSIPFTILSLQRALWLSAGIGFLTSIIAGFFSPLKKPVRLILFFGILTFLLYFSIRFVMHILERHGEMAGIRAIAARAMSLRTLSQAHTYRIRIQEMKDVLHFKLADHHLITGWGLGDEFQSTYPFPRMKNFLDNSYLLLTWKLGILGIFTFILLLIRHLKFFYTFIKKREDAAWAIGYFSSIVSLLFLATTISIFLYYRIMIIVWGLIGLGYGRYKDTEK